MTNPLLDPSYVTALVLKYAALVLLTQYATEVLKRLGWLSNLSLSRRATVYPLVALAVAAVLVWLPPLFYGAALTGPVAFEQLAATVFVWVVSQGLVKRQNDLAARAAGGGR